MEFHSLIFLSNVSLDFIYAPSDCISWSRKWHAYISNSRSSVGCAIFPFPMHEQCRVDNGSISTTIICFLVTFRKRKGEERILVVENELNGTGLLLSQMPHTGPKFVEKLAKSVPKRQKVHSFVLNF